MKSSFWMILVTRYLDTLLLKAEKKMLMLVGWILLTDYSRMFYVLMFWGGFNCCMVMDMASWGRWKPHLASLIDRSPSQHALIRETSIIFLVVHLYFDTKLSSCMILIHKIKFMYHSRIWKCENDSARQITLFIFILSRHLLNFLCYVIMPSYIELLLLSN